jgi:cell division protein FtsN
MDYFAKIKDIKVVTPDDGIKRYVIGVYNTKEEAISVKEKMTQLGYTEAFVRTMDSLYQ